MRDAYARLNEMLEMPDTPIEHIGPQAALATLEELRTANLIEVAKWTAGERVVNDQPIWDEIQRRLRITEPQPTRWT